MLFTKVMILSKKSLWLPSNNTKNTSIAEKHYDNNNITYFNNPRKQKSTSLRKNLIRVTISITDDLPTWNFVSKDPEKLKIKEFYLPTKSYMKFYKTYLDIVKWINVSRL